MKRSARISVVLLGALGIACGTGPDAGGHLRDTEQGSASLPASLAGALSGEPPNIVLVMTDDQGYGDFGFAGNPVIETPHLDALAAQSARVERFYVSPVCTPTRASLMTGRYNYRIRAIDTYIGRAMMEPEEVTVAEMLRDAGYATGIFGKWHLYFQFHRGDEPIPFHAFAAVGPRYKMVHPSPRGAGDWNGELALELYDLEADPGEIRNLISELPEVAAAMSDAYLEWFEDVSSTRPDNYAPPRIVVGTDQEPVTVLTRQNWRRISDDQGWRPTSRGRWLLTAREGATFDVEVRLVAGSTGTLRLDIGDRTLNRDLEPEQRTVIFEGVAVAAGDFALSASGGKGDDHRGAHQIVLRRR